MIRTTELLKHFNLYKDFNFTDDKRDFGIELHKAIEKSSSCPASKWDFDDKIYQYYKQFINFISHSKIKILHQEHKIINEQLGLSGTIDIIGEKENDIYIIDIKSSLSHQPVYQIQTALYYLLLKQEFLRDNKNINNIKRCCLMLSETTYKLINHTDTNDINIAISLLNIYNWKKQNGLLKEDNNESS